MFVKLKNNIATSETGFIFNPGTGDSYSTNPIGNEILNFLKSGLSAEEIKEKLMANYEVEPMQLNRDWEDFLLQLKEANLISF